MQREKEREREREKERNRKKEKSMPAACAFFFDVLLEYVTDLTQLASLGQNLSLSLSLSLFEIIRIRVLPRGRYFTDLSLVLFGLHVCLESTYFQKSGPAGNFRRKSDDSLYY